MTAEVKNPSAISIDDIKKIVQGGKKGPKEKDAAKKWMAEWLKTSFMKEKAMGRKFFKSADIKKVTIDEIKLVVETGKQSSQLKEAAILWILDLLEGFCVERINTTGRIYGAELEELLEAAKVAVIANYDKYNPDIAKPTSFFLPYIDEYTKAECRFTNPSSPYYINMRTKLNQVAQENGYESMMDPRLPEDTLAVLSGVALHSVIKCKEFATYTIVHSDAGELAEGASYDTPEKAVMSKSETEELLESMDLLTTLEKWVITKRHLEDEPMSYRSMVTLIKSDPELEKRFSEETTISQVYLEQAYNKAIAKLRNSRAIKRMDYKKEETKPIIESIPSQATDTEIETGIARGLIDFT